MLPPEVVGEPLLSFESLNGRVNRSITGELNKM
jgi:hypothetical protein